MLSTHNINITVFCLGLLLTTIVSCQNKKPPAEMPQLLNLTAIDSAVRPQDDFFEYANGTWLKDTKIPASQSIWGGMYTLGDKSLFQIRDILDSLSGNQHLEYGSNAQKVGDLYTSAMDSAVIEKLGASPIQTDIERIEGINNVQGILDEAALEYRTMPVSPFFDFYAAPDDKNSDWEVAHFDQGGLGLPNRDYYFKKDSSMQKIRKAYLEYMGKIFELLGDDTSTAEKAAHGVMMFETSLAGASKDPVALRDPQANYHKMTVAQLTMDMPALNWQSLLKALKVGQDTLLVGQPGFYKNLAESLTKTSLSDLKNYLKFHLANGYAPYLSKEFVNARFKFIQNFTGQQEMQPRWKRMAGMVDGQLGDALGQLYVKKFFPPSSKARMDKLVGNLMQTYAERIQKLDWMGDTTKQKALQKMHAMVKKIGYPDKWKDYSSVRISRDSLVANISQCVMFAYNYDINKIGKPVDRTEWHMTAPTVNAYYNPTANDINFPAGILQPPIFFANGDDAINYGAIGWVIGHEMTHGFDDQGRQYDALGNLKDWWTPEDAKRFKQKAQLVIDQYDGYTVLDSLHLNGKLTLGENIADIGGLAIAYAAFQKTEEAQSGRLIDGLTPDQRFFMSMAQVWRVKVRPQNARTRLLNDHHSPPKFRVDGTTSNNDGFYKAFDVKPGDGMYRPDSIRVRIW